MLSTVERDTESGVLTRGMMASQGKRNGKSARDGGVRRTLERFIYMVTAVSSSGTLSTDSSKVSATVP